VKNPPNERGFTVIDVSDEDDFQAVGGLLDWNEDLLGSEVHNKSIFRQGSKFLPIPANFTIADPGSKQYKLVMTFKAIVHQEESGGYWAEVPAIPGCATQGETLEELEQNLREAIQGCLSVEVGATEPDTAATIMEVAV
jgi:predicted RNase H-like HicB family nuclease